MAADDWVVLPESEQVIDLRELFCFRRTGQHSVQLHFKNDKSSEVSVADAKRICDKLGLQGEDIERLLESRQQTDDDPREEYDVLDEIEVPS